MLFLNHLEYIQNTGLSLKVTLRILNLSSQNYYNYNVYVKVGTHKKQVFSCLYSLKINLCFCKIWAGNSTEAAETSLIYCKLNLIIAQKKLYSEKKFFLQVPVCPCVFQSIHSECANGSQHQNVVI